MKNRTTNWRYSFIILATLSFSGCGTYFGPGLTNTAAHLETPGYRDENRSANYVSGQLGFGNRFDDEDNNYFGSASFHRANTFEYGSLAYGAFGYLGNYSVSTLELPSLSGKKSYGGVGAMFSGNFHVPFEKVDFEVIKFTTRLYNELGEYPQFKRELISVDRNSYYEDLYTRHNSIVDMAIGMGVKIKHNNQSATRISTGVVTHILGTSCSDGGYCDFGEPELLGINFQVGHTLSNRLSLNWYLATSSWHWNSSSSYPVSTFGVTYRFGERSAVIR